MRHGMNFLGKPGWRGAALSATALAAAGLLAACGLLPAAPPEAPTELVTPSPAGPPTATPLPTLTPTQTATPTATPGPGLDELLQTPVARYTAAELEEAAADYAALAALYPLRAEPWLGQATIAQRNGDDEAALAYLLRAVEAEPTSFEAWRRLAVVYEQQGRTSEAAEVYGQMITLVPGDPDLYIARAMAQARMGQAQAAIDDLRSAQALDPYREYAWLNVAGAAYGGRAYETAIAIANGGLEAYPASTALRILSGQARLAQGDTEAALADFTAAAGQNERDYIALRWQGEALAQLGRNEEAIAAFQQAGALGTGAGAGGQTTGFEAMTSAARLMAQSDPTAAFEYLAQQVIRFGQPPPLLIGYALIELERGDPGAAANRLSNLIDRYNYVPAFYWRGVINAQQGRSREAIADLSAFLVVRPTGPEAEAARALLESLGVDPDTIVAPTATPQPAAPDEGDGD